MNSGPCNLDQTWFKCRESSQITSAYLSGIASAAAKDIKKMGATKTIRIWTFFGLKKHFTSSHTLTIRELKSHTGVKKGPNCVLIKKMGSTEKQTKRWQNRISWTRDLFWVSTCWNFSSLEPSCQGLSLPLWKKKDKLQSKSIWHKKAQEANKLSKTFFQKLFHHVF